MLAGKCDICGKISMAGFNVSHSKRHTKRTWSPNIQRHTLVVAGIPARLRICNSCLRTLSKQS